MINSVNDLKAFAVLIETSWNVKENPVKIKSVVNPVLIETSWNVKDVSPP